MMLFQVDPLSGEYSSVTNSTVPAVVQVMVWELPASQVSPPFGDVIVNCVPRSENTSSLVSVGVPSSASAMRTNACCEEVSGMVQS